MSIVMSVKETLKHTHAVWFHSDCVWDVRENTDAVSSVLTVDETVSLKIETVDICLCAQSWQVPRYFICLTHGQAWEVPIYKPIEGWERKSHIDVFKLIKHLSERVKNALWLPHTVHLVALHKAFILLVNCAGSCSVGPDVVIQIPAQVFIKHCSQEVVLFIIVFLHQKKKEDERQCQTVKGVMALLSSSSLYDLLSLSLPCRWLITVSQCTWA